jgi:hypothetical protein
MPLLFNVTRGIGRAALRAVAVGALVVAAGCQTPTAPPPTVAPPAGPPSAVFTPTDYANVPGWKDVAHRLRGRHSARQLQRLRDGSARGYCGGRRAAPEGRSG